MSHLTDPVLPEESGRVDAALGQRLVDIARPGHRFERAWRIGEGVKAVSWLLDVEGVETVVAKFFRPESEERMSRELGFHAVCTLDDPRLPVLLGSQPAVPGEQLGVVLTNCLMGQRLADGAGATESDKRDVYKQSSTLLHQLHGFAMQEKTHENRPHFKPDPLHGKAMQGREADFLHGKAMQGRGGGFGALGAPATHGDARAYALSRSEAAIERFGPMNNSPALNDRLTGWLGERAAGVDRDVPAVLCHGDFSMWNMLVEWRDGRHHLSGVFDFESSYAGDPLMDLASAWVLTDSWGDPGEPELAAIESGYGSLRERREEDFAFYVVLEQLKLWTYYAERGAPEAAADVERAIARQIER